MFEPLLWRRRWRHENERYNYLLFIYLLFIYVYVTKAPIELSLISLDIGKINID